MLKKVVERESQLGRAVQRSFRCAAGTAPASRTCSTTGLQRELWRYRPGPGSCAPAGRAGPDWTATLGRPSSGTAQQQSMQRLVLQSILITCMARSKRKERGSPSTVSRRPRLSCSGQTQTYNSKTAHLQPADCSSAQPLRPAHTALHQLSGTKNSNVEATCFWLNRVLA